MTEVDIMTSAEVSCTKCGREMLFAPEVNRCSGCGEPLEVKYVTDGKISKVLYRTNFMARYSDFYPYLDIENIVSLGEGNTGLVQTDKLAEEIGFEPGSLYIKNETQNPTWSFKDRGTVVGANFARDKGYTRLGVVSSGNNAASCAAYAAALGMKAFIFVPSHILEEKVLPIAVYGATVVKIEGDYGKLYYDSEKLGKEYGIFFANSDVPTRVEGAKSIAFEICEQMDFDLPDWIIIPYGSGGTLRGIEKGFAEFKASGLIKKIPKIVGVQPEGCSPFYRAWEKGESQVSHFGKMFTIAHGVANPFPPSGNQVLRLIKEGRVSPPVMILEKDILHWHRQMALSGVFAQPESCLPLAAAKQLLDDGTIKKNERVVLLATGSGLKASSLLSKTQGYNIHQEKLENLDELIKKMI